MTRSISALKRKEALQPEGTEASPGKELEEEKAKTSKKRKSEIEQLDSPKTESRTRRKVVHKEAEAPTPTSTPRQLEREEQTDIQAKAIPVRRKQIARKTRVSKPESAQWYPFISSKAKTAYNDILRGKQPIKERALDLSGADDKLRSIITDLGWTKFCAKPDEGALQLVKEFYANLEDMVDDKVFVRGVWVSLTSEEISKDMGNISDLPTFSSTEFAGTSQPKMKKKVDAKASPPPPKMRRKTIAKRQKYTTDVESEGEEEIAAHLGEGDTTGHFAHSNLSSDEEKTE